MVAGTTQKLLGVGLYTPSEAALYARIHPSVVSRWIHGTRAAEPVVRPAMPNDPDRTVTFLDFVQSLAIRAIRRDFAVPLQQIRKAVDHVRRKYRIEFPFAMKHRTFFFDGEILIHLSDKQLVQITGKDKGQEVHKQVAEMYMEDLSYGSDGLANEYRAFAHEGREIIMNPAHQFGQPMVKGRGYTAFALYHAYQTEGSAQAAAEVYDVDVGDVKLAIRYYDYLYPDLKGAQPA